MTGYEIRKYPRTPHLEGSRLQPGDEDLSQIPFSAIVGKHLVIEEKIDGANSAVSFDGDCNLLLQSRGHYLTGGYKERHYNLMKRWATFHQDALFDVLGCRYIMYGEWMYAKHAVYYDALPHYFMEFDIFDRETGIFLDTPSRRKLTSRLPICSVPVLAEGEFAKKEDVLKYLGDSNFKTAQGMEKLRETAEKNGLDAERIIRETDPTMTMEGLYIKIEENGQVAERVKFVRSSFLQCIDMSDSRWQDRPIVPNGLCRDLEDLYLPELK